MTKEERLERARQSLARAVTHKDERDVSEEVCSCIANLMAANEPFTALDTSEHEIRGILGQGFISEIRRVLSRWAPVPRPNENSPQVRLQELVKRATNAFALVEVKMDNDTAVFIATNDPFLAELDEPGALEKGRRDVAALLKDIDLDALFEERPEDSGVVACPQNDDPVLEIIEADELDDRWFIIVDDPFPLVPKRSVPPPLPRHAGIGDSEAERRFFARTG
jgi:hypothetical protein